MSQSVRVGQGEPCRALSRRLAHLSTLPTSSRRLHWPALRQLPASLILSKSSQPQLSRPPAPCAPSCGCRSKAYDARALAHSLSLPLHGLSPPWRSLPRGTKPYLSMPPVVKLNWIHPHFMSYSIEFPYLFSHAFNAPQFRNPPDETSLTSAHPRGRVPAPRLLRLIQKD
jgi:hypothetical protein